jgi:hypothetical protein
MHSMNAAQFAALTVRVACVEQTMQRRRWRAVWWVTAGFLLGWVLGTRPVARGARADDAAVARLEQEARDSVLERQRLCQDVLQIQRASWNLGAPVANQPDLIYDWSTRLLGTQIYLSLPEHGPRVEDPEVYLALPNVPPNPVRLAAFQAHLARMRQWEDRLRPLVRDRIMPPLDFKSIQAHRQQAELWILRERLKSAAAGAVVQVR